MKQINNEFFKAINIVLYEDEDADCADALITEHVTNPRKLDRFVKACLVDMRLPVETTEDFFNHHAEEDWLWVSACEDEDGDDNHLIVTHIDNEWYATYYSKWGFQTDSQDWQLD